MPSLHVQTDRYLVFGADSGCYTRPNRFAARSGIRFGLFLSGQGSVDPATGAVVKSDVGEQTLRTLDNLMGVLEASGATLKNVVNMRVTLRDVADFSRFNETIHDYLEGEKVTWTCIGGSKSGGR